VKTHCITHKIAEFIRALAAGRTLGESIDVTSAAEGLSVLIGAKIAIGLGDNVRPLRH
jgi:hypothetical protein